MSTDMLRDSTRSVGDMVMCIQSLQSLGGRETRPFSFHGLCHLAPSEEGGSRTLIGGLRKFFTFGLYTHG